MRIALSTRAYAPSIIAYAFSMALPSMPPSEESVACTASATKRLLFIER